MNLIAIIQARNSSVRLSGKVLADLAGKKALERVIERTIASDVCSQVVVATSNRNEDQSIFDLCQSMRTECYRGDLDDVLDRYVQTARLYKADAVIRITGDCPLIDPHVIHRVASVFKKGDYDYVSNVIRRSYPDGLDVEIIAREALERIHKEAVSHADREHVTKYLVEHSDLFRTEDVEQKDDLSLLRWVLDYPEDLLFIRKIFEHFQNRSFFMEDILFYLRKSPEVSSLNTCGLRI